MAKQDQHYQSLAQTCKILGDATRLRILHVLGGGESNVSCLCDQLNLPQPTVSHHLGILKMGGLVSNRRKGKCIFYTVQSTNGQTGKAIKLLLK